MKPRPILLKVVSLALLFLAANSFAQKQPAPPEQTISGLADQLALRLHAARANRVLVLDLRGPQSEVHPLGKWLADQLSVALQSNSPDLVLLDRTQLNDQSGASASSPPNTSDFAKVMALGRSLGADAVVQGTYAKISQRLGISLTANPPRPGPFLNVAAALPMTAALPISDEVAVLSPDPIPSFRDGILRAGVAATPSPVCIRCPNPEYTDEARRAKLQGSVVLDVTINPQGRVDDAVVLRGPGHGLEQKSIDAVKKWQFKPVLDINGNPASVRCNVEVTFRLLRGPH
jgi:TonB family protein